MSWKCKKCDRTFEEIQKPLKHGNLIGNIVGGFKDVSCEGEIVHITKPYYELKKAETNLPEKLIKRKQKPLLVHLPERYIKDLDSLVPELYPDRCAAIRMAVRDLLKREVWRAE